METTVYIVISSLVSGVSHNLKTSSYAPMWNPNQGQAYDCPNGSHVPMKDIGTNELCTFLWCIITLQCCILARTSLFSPAYVRFWPIVRPFLALWPCPQMNTLHPVWRGGDGSFSGFEFEVMDDEVQVVNKTLDTSCWPAQVGTCNRIMTLLTGWPVGENKAIKVHSFESWPNGP